MGFGRPLVGRVNEMAELSATLEAVREKNSRLVLIRGDPGIGKSRLCEELSALAKAQGFQVAIGPCWETPGAPAFWPWVQLLDALGVPASPLRTLLSGTETGLSPETLRHKASGLAIATLREAACRPLLLIFEDLHAADLPSLQLLQVVVRSLKHVPLFWLLTSRLHDARLTEDISGALARVAREGVLLLPSALEQAAVAQMAELYLGRALPHDVVAQVARSTEGTPLFVEGTLRLIGSRGDALPLPLPQSAHDVLRDRIGLLPERSREALELAAVIGHTFSRRMLALATGQTESELDALLRPAVEAGVLRELTLDGLSFSHALLREALYEGLAARRKGELHLRIFGALRANGASAQELAHHALCSLPLGSEDEAVALVHQAAKAAETMLAFHRAVELYERALAAIDFRRPTLRRTELWLSLSTAHLNAGHQQRAIDAAERAAADARELADAERLARAALASGAVFRLGLVDRSLVRLLEEAIAGLGASFPALHVVLRARLASALQPAADPREPVCLAIDAIDAARPLGPETLKTALHFGLSAMADVTDAGAREPLLVELVELARSTRDRTLEHRTLARLAMTLYEMGERARAEQCVAELDALGHEFGLTWRVWPLLFRSMRALLEGRFSDAALLTREIDPLVAMSDPDEFRATLETHHIFGLIIQARHTEVLASLDSFHASMRNTPMGTMGADRIIVAFIAAMAGDLPRATTALSGLSQEAFLYPDRGLAFCAALAVGILGDAQRAALLESCLKEMRQPFASQGLLGMSLSGPFSWARGWLCAAQGRKDEALHWFGIALEETRNFGARALAFWILRDRAKLGGAPEDFALLAREAVALGISIQDVVPQTAGRAQAKLPTQTTPTLVREGDSWRLCAYGEEIRLKDSRGMLMLAILMARPGCDIHVLELSGSDSTAGGDAGEVLDDKARAEYRMRAASLREELEEAEQFHDQGRVERVREELEFLASALSAGFGLGGRSRRAASNTERARSNVQRRIKDALARIEEHSPLLGRQLARSVTTGLLCRFEESQ